MADQVRVGIAGIGFMGRIFFENCRKNPKCRVTAIASSDPKKLAGDWGATGGNIGEAGAEKADLTGVRGYSDVGELVRDPEVDLVILALPTFLHARWTLETLAAGKHVLCEKPITVTPAEGREVVAAAAQAPGKLMIAHCLRFWPEYVWAREHVVDGREYGAVLSAGFTRLSATPGWSSGGWIVDADRGGNAALELHIHDADTARWFFCEPEAVWASGTVGVVSNGGVDHITARYRYPGLKGVSAEGGWAYAPGFPFRMGFTLVCERATVVYESTARPTLCVYPREGGSLVPELPAGDAYATELDYFLDCIREDRDPTVTTAADALRSLELVAAELESVRAGGAWVGLTSPI
ncbi:MAG: Gfo/Idh/MocA family protein [Planctomycetota bacterium]|jgi:predicted dehydrogenase